MTRNVAITPSKVVEVDFVSRTTCQNFAVWKDSTSDGYWKAAGVLAIWTLAALIVTTLRLLASSPRLVGTLVPATWSAAVVTAAVSTEMVLNEDGGPWKVVVVLVILTALGYALTPALQRFWAGAETPRTAERLLGTLGGIDVFAVRGRGRSVTIGSSRARPARVKVIILRERTSVEIDSASRSTGPGARSFHPRPTRATSSLPDRRAAAPEEWTPRSISTSMRADRLP